MPVEPRAAAEAATTNQLALNPAAITRVLGFITLFLILAHVAGQLVGFFTGNYRTGGIVRLFNLDMEANIPSSYSMILLLMAAVLLALITALESRRSAPGVGYWLLLTAGFVTMAFDEACSFHEKLIRPLHALVGERELGIFYFAWVVPGFVLVAGLGLLFAGFLRRLPARTRRAFSTTGLIYLAGALGVELIAGRHYEIHGFNNLTYAFLVVAEEGLEMTGVILFLRALLAYLQDHHGEVNFRFRNNPGA